MSLRRRIIITVIILVLFSTFLIAPWVFTEAPRKFLLEVKVVRKEKLTPALVYARAYYPSGMRFIGVVKAPNGIAWIWIDYTSWREAWQEEKEERGFFANPTVVLTIFTEDNYVGLFAVKLKWDDLKPYALGGKKTVIVEPKIKRVKGKPVKISRIAKQSIIPFIRIPKLFPEKPPGQAILVDFYEAENRTNLGKIYFDPSIGNGSGYLSMDYYYYKKVGISLSFAFVSTEEWNIQYDFISIGSDKPGSADIVVNSNNPVGYISIIVRYRFEHWQYLWEGEIIDEEYDLWIVNFYPNTMSTEKGLDVSIQFWNIKYEGYGKGINEPTYKEHTFEVDGHAFAVDLLWFAKLLKQLGKIPEAVAGYIGWAFLFVHLNAYEESAYAFGYDLLYYVPSDVYVIIDKGKHDFRGTLHNALYWNAIRE